MASGSIMASAPGSLMLLGEHAVLHGRLAVVAAVDRRIAVRLTPRRDTHVVIRSALGEYETELSHLEPVEPFRFVLAALRRQASRLTTGFDISVEAQFSHRIGFGSSAAVTVATTAALHAACGDALDPPRVASEGVEVIRAVQGLGSGADVAASVHGGLLTYRAQPIEVEKLAPRYPLTAVYSGSKMPTPEVVKRVETQRADFPHIYNEIYDLMEQCSLDAFDAIAHQDWPTLGRLLNIAQGFMEAIGVNNARLAGIVYGLREDPAILGSKISGSGLGDCVVALGRTRREHFAYEIIPVDIAPEGVRIDPA
jgi:mevalonate kinase